MKKKKNNFDHLLTLWFDIFYRTSWSLTGHEKSLRLVRERKKGRGQSGVEEGRVRKERLVRERREGGDRVVWKKAE